MSLNYHVEAFLYSDFQVVMPKFCFILQKS